MRSLAVDGIITSVDPLLVTVWRRMTSTLVTWLRKAPKAKDATVAQRPDRILAAGLTKTPKLNEAANANPTNTIQRPIHRRRKRAF